MARNLRLYLRGGTSRAAMQRPGPLAPSGAHAFCMRLLSVGRDQGRRGERRGEMRAVAVFPQTRDVRLIQVDEPQISRRSEVKVRILDVGICGTDREICSFHYCTPPPG